MSHHAPPLRFDDAHLNTGVRLRYAEQGDATGHPVILLHGYTDSWFSYSCVLPLLGANYHAYALDLRGHGDSDRPPNGYDLSELAADVSAFIDAKELKRVTLVGHSMGSFIARHVALDRPDRVARLVLIGSATTVHNEAVLNLRREVDALEDPVPEEFAREFQDSTIYRPLPHDFMDRVVAESLKLPANVWRAVMAAMLADRAVPLGDIQVPTLILWGDQDLIFSEAEQELLAAQNRKAVLKVYKQTGHALHWERPQEFVQDLESFIAGTESR